MKKLFTLLAALMFTFAVSFAQQNFYFWGKNGNVSTVPISQVDSLTFSVGSWLFQIAKPVSLGATTSAFQGSAKVALNDKVKSIDVSPEVGICYSDENSVPTYSDRRQKLGSTMQDYSFTIMNVTSGTTYYYRTYVKLLDEVYYSAVNSITTMGEKTQDKIINGHVNSITTMGEKTQDNIINGHKFVDLGLPSGLLWAETNVGASSSTDDGDYFAWGETKPKPKSTYSWRTYKWGRTPSKYNDSDGKTTLDAADDAATVNWGVGCRMPDSSDFQELNDECNWSWTSDYKGASGYLVTGSNGQSIFFPASGFCFYDGLRYHGSNGYYLSRSLLSDDAVNALFFRSGYVRSTGDNYRYDGFSVRPVAEK